MPTIPLYSDPPNPNAWHRVTAPGGYEWWHFDAEDAARDLHVVAAFYDGLAIDPAYLRADARYRRRPTRHRPALPAEFPAVHLALYKCGKPPLNFTARFSTAQFAARTDAVEVSIGPHQLRTTQAGGLSLAVRGPLHVELNFQPRFAAAGEKSVAGGMHHWMVANPLCDVSGTIGSPEVKFRGRGYHDHHWGTASLATSLRRWMCGRMLLDDAAYAFHLADSHANVVHADAAGTRSVQIADVDADWSGRTKWLLRYPRRMALGNVLRLENPQVIDSSPYRVRLIYQAAAGDRRGSALCEILYPQRLRNPLVGRLVQRSIDKQN